MPAMPAAVIKTEILVGERFLSVFCLQPPCLTHYPTDTALSLPRSRSKVRCLTSKRCHSVEILSFFFPPFCIAQGLSALLRFSDRLSQSAESFTPPSAITPSSSSSSSSSAPTPPSGGGGASMSLSLRQLIRLARRYTHYPDGAPHTVLLCFFVCPPSFRSHWLLLLSLLLVACAAADLADSLRRTLMLPFLPHTLRERVDALVTSFAATINAPTSSSSSSSASLPLRPPRVESGNLIIGNVAYPIATDVQHPELVPHILFYDIPSHILLLQHMLKDFLVNERHLLLIGNQVSVSDCCSSACCYSRSLAAHALEPVDTDDIDDLHTHAQGLGKNKLADRLLQLLNMELYDSSSCFRYWNEPFFPPP